MNSHEKLETAFKVATYETDLFGKMNIFSLFNHFQELAGEHAENLGVGYNMLRESKSAWILSRIKLEINRLPSWGETVYLTTWPKGIDRLFAMREFSLKNEAGETLVLATTAWLLVDIEKNRPKRVESLPVNLLYTGAPHAIKEIPDKIKLPENMVRVFNKQVWLSDIDVNSHVNNAQYAKWICNCFPKEKYAESRISSLQINFLEETLTDDTVELLKNPETDEKGEYYICGKSSNKGTIVFHAVVKWL